MTSGLNTGIESVLIEQVSGNADTTSRDRYCISLKTESVLEKQKLRFSPGNHYVFDLPRFRLAKKKRLQNVTCNYILQVTFCNLFFMLKRNLVTF